LKLVLEKLFVQVQARLLNHTKLGQEQLILSLKF